MHRTKGKTHQHISFGFRGESIFYELNGKEYELWATWIEGRRIYLDDLRKTSLDENQKIRMFSEIIQFVQEMENEKPIICYNSDYQDTELWKRLTAEFSSEIKSVEITTIEKENEVLYKSMSDDLKTGLTEHRIKGLKIKSVNDLDKHWNQIKF